MKKIILSLIILFCSASLSFAQSPVITQPFGVMTYNASGVISPSSFIFQTIWPANTTRPGRSACKIQNNGTHTMYVYFGPTPVTPSSYNLAAGLAMDCNIGGTVLQDQVNITGTAGDVFYADQR